MPPVAIKSMGEPQQWLGIVGDPEMGRERQRERERGLEPNVPEGGRDGGWFFKLRNLAWFFDARERGRDGEGKREEKHHHCCW